MALTKFIAVALPLLAAAASSASHPAPVIFWSDMAGAFGDASVSAARATVAGDKVGEWIGAHLDTDLLVVVAGSHGVSSGLAGAPELRKAIEGAPASAVAPLVAKSLGGAASPLWAAAAAAKNGGERLSAGSWDEALALVASRTSKEGRCDVLVVDAPDALDVEARSNYLKGVRRRVFTFE